MVRYLLYLGMALTLLLPAYAVAYQQPEGFGVAHWGMSREAIVEAEGVPDMMDDTNGTLVYLNKTMLGKPAELTYRFEKGCTDMVSPPCRFADGYAIFKDGSKEHADQLDKLLTQRYGQPESVTQQVQASQNSYYVSSGKKVMQKTVSVRRVGGVQVVHTFIINRYDFTNVVGETFRAGPYRNILHFYGPYYRGRTITGDY